MEILLYVFVASALFSIGSVWNLLKEVWRAYRNKQRSGATAMAITCIVGGFPTIFGALLLEQKPPSIIQQALQMAGIVLMFSAGILGGIGLICDRRLAKHRSVAETESAIQTESELAESTSGDSP